MKTSDKVRRLKILDLQLTSAENKLVKVSGKIKRLQGDMVKLFESIPQCDKNLYSEKLSALKFKVDGGNDELKELHKKYCVCGGAKDYMNHNIVTKFDERY